VKEESVVGTGETREETQMAPAMQSAMATNRPRMKRLDTFPLSLGDQSRMDTSDGAKPPSRETLSRLGHGLHVDRPPFAEASWARKHEEQSPPRPSQVRLLPVIPSLGLHRLLK